jgi:hypothetical protein
VQSNRPLTRPGEHTGDVAPESNFVAVQEGGVVFLDIDLSVAPTVTRRRGADHGRGECFNLKLTDSLFVP